MHKTRFIVERHTTHPAYCWQVLDTHTGQRHGSSMRLDDAIMLADAHENLVAQPHPRDLEPAPVKPTIHGPRL